MPGSGFTRKKYYLNWNRERTAFGTEETPTSLQTAIVGELQDAPSFKPSNDPIKTKRHSQLGANSNVLKGRFAGTMGLNMTVQTFARSLYRILGRTLDQPKTFTISNSAGGDFTAADTIAVAGGGEVLGVIASLSGTGDAQVITLELFNLDEIVSSNGGTGQAGTLFSIEFDGTNYIATLHDVSTAYVVGDDLLGTVSTALRGVIAVGALVGGVQTLTFATIATSGGNHLIDDTVPTSSATVTAITVWNHRIAAHREQASYSINYSYESLNIQHLMTGATLKQLGFESASNEAPKFTEDWVFQDNDHNNDRDVEVVNSSALYEYVDVVDSINAVAYTDVLKSFTCTFNRSNQEPIDSHQSLAPTGFKGAEVETTLSFEIHREDKELLDHRTDDDKITITLTFTRGTVGEDDAVLTFTNSRLLETEEGGSNTILLTVPVEMEGTPTAEVNDAIADITA